jgi:hypothetical protein
LDDLQVTADEAKLSDGQDNEDPVQVSSTSQTPLADLQTVVEGA